MGQSPCPHIVENRRIAEQRAFPPLGGQLSVDEAKRSFVPYEFTFPPGSPGP